MSFGQVEGFVVDSCILLPHPIESLMKSCANFLKEAAGRCFLCSSIKEEALKLIDDSHSVIVSDFRTHLKPFLEKHGIKELTNRHGRFFAQFFSERRRHLKKTHPTRSNVRNEMIGTIESYVASQLHSLKDGFKIQIVDFLASMITELTIKKHRLEAPFRSMKCLDIVPDSSIISEIVLGTFLLNPNDVKHLASALTHQFQQNKWVIFVTTDEREILSKEKEMFEIFALQCSKPDWALDYYRDMTRMKPPVEFFREIQCYSVRQKGFGITVEKALSMKILG